MAVSLWEQISSLPLRDQLDLAERIQAGVPHVPLDLLPNDPKSLTEALAQARNEAATSPERLMPAETLVESIRSELRL